MTGPLNLATRPFRNELLPRLLLGVAWVAALGLTALHVVAARQLLQRRSEARLEELDRLEAKLRRMTERSASGAAGPDEKHLVQWAQLKEIVDQRMFSWTSLMASLEQVVPAGVRVVSLSPHQKRDHLTVDMEALAHTQEEVLELLTRLEASPEFSEVLPLLFDEDEGLRKLRCQMVYSPSPTGASGAAGGGRP